MSTCLHGIPGEPWVASHGVFNFIILKNKLHIVKTLGIHKISLVHRIIESENNKLWSILKAQTSGNGFASTIAISARKAS